MRHRTVKWTALVLLALSVLAGGCATDEDFIKARRLDSVSAYREYIRKHPDGANRESAEKRLSVLQEQERKAEEKKRQRREAFAKAKKEGTFEAYQAYLEKYTSAFDKAGKRDDDTRAAVESFRRLAAITVLRGEGPVSATPKSAKEFPFELFSVRDLLKTGGAMVMKFAQVETEATSVIHASGSSGRLVGTARSSKDPSVSVVFYSDPDSRLTFGITVKRTKAAPVGGPAIRSLRTYRRLVSAMIELPEELRGGEQTIELTGRALAVVTRGESREVYAFGAWPGN